MATLFRVDGSKVSIAPKNGRYFSLEELQEYVGGNIELTPHFDPSSNLVLVVNEEGKNKGMKWNKVASLYAKCWPLDVLVGDVVMCDMNEVR